MKTRLVTISVLSIFIGVVVFAGSQEKPEFLTTNMLKTDQLRLITPDFDKIKLVSPGGIDKPAPGTVTTLKPGISMASSSDVKNGDRETFSYHNNSPSFGLSGYGAGCVEAIEFFTYFPVKLLKVRFYSVGAPNPMTFNFAPSFGGALPDFENPYFPSIILRR